jgi:hypothetical protein
MSATATMQFQLNLEFLLSPLDIMEQSILQNIRAKDPLIKFDCTSSLPSGAKAHGHFSQITARLKPCPFKASTLSKHRPFQSIDRFKASIVSKHRPFQSIDRFKASIVSKLRSLQSIDRFKASIISKHRPFQSIDPFKASIVSKHRPDRRFQKHKARQDNLPRFALRFCFVRR